MRTELLNYTLPSELIAQHPAGKRTESRLLVMNRYDGTLSDKQFSKIIDYFEPDDCLVLNDTRVLPARFFAHRTTGAQLEGLFLNLQGDGLWEVMLKNARKIKPNEIITLSNRQKQDFCKAKAIQRLEEGKWTLLIDHENTDPQKILNRIGYAPLPPYIKRIANDNNFTQTDLDRYQTIYAKNTGAVAAPTAGLHFNEQFLLEIQKKGVKLAYVTLHVGAGTFKPVKTETLQQHNMHTEKFSISKENADLINTCSANGKRIIAVGTTSVRTLETIAKGKTVEPCQSSTRLFILPGYKFKIVDAMVTNFHLPKSTLLALVGAFAGLDNIMAAYRHAIEQEYRFYSYGDAMLII